MNVKTLTAAFFIAAAAPAFGQTLYKCQSIPGGPVAFQQTPCADGGGEAQAVRAIPSGAGSGLSEQAHHYLGERDRHRAEQAAAAETERQRQEVLRVERDKVKAAEAQAAAQRATARAIWATGRRY